MIETPVDNPAGPLIALKPRGVGFALDKTPLGALCFLSAPSPCSPTPAGSPGAACWDRRLPQRPWVRVAVGPVPARDSVFALGGDQGPPWGTLRMALRTPALGVRDGAVSFAGFGKAEFVPVSPWMSPLRVLSPWGAFRHSPVVLGQGAVLVPAVGWVHRARAVPAGTVPVSWWLLC